MESSRASSASVSKLGTAGGLRVSFEAKGRDYRLRLAPNPRLARWATGSRWQHYAGELEQVPDSWARLSIAGNSAERRDFRRPTTSGAGARRRYGGDALSTGGSTLRAPGFIQGRRGSHAVGHASSRGQPGFVRLEGLSAARKLEISAIGDATFRARYASDELARDALLSRLNIVDGIFSTQVGVAIEVTSVNMADALSDSLDASTDPPILLDSLGRLRQQTVDAQLARSHASVHRPQPRWQQRGHWIHRIAVQPTLQRQPRAGTRQRRSGRAHQRARDRPRVRRPARRGRAVRRDVANAIHHGADTELPGDLVFTMQPRADGAAGRQRLLPGTVAAAGSGAALEPRQS